MTTLIINDSHNTSNNLLTADFNDTNGTKAFELFKGHQQETILLDDEGMIIGYDIQIDPNFINDDMIGA